MRCKAFIPRALLTRRRESSFLEDVCQMFLEGCFFLLWTAWVKTSEICSLDTGRIRLSSWQDYRLYGMSQAERKQADCLTLKIYEALIEANLYQERSRSKCFYDFVRDRYYKVIELPRVFVRVSRDKNFQKNLFIKIRFSPQALAKMGSDQFLTQLNQVLATNESGLAASDPITDEQGWLTYSLSLAGYSPRLEINAFKDLPISGSSLSVKIDEDHIWNMSHEFSGILAGASGTGKTSFLIYILLLVSTQKIRVFICDGKNDQLASLAREFLPEERWASGSDSKYVIHYLLEVMKARYQYLQGIRKEKPEKTFESVQRDKHLPPILLILDEGASIVAGMSKKEQATYLKELQQLAQMGRAANMSILMAFQQPNALSLPTAIRDQLTGLKTILGSPSQISPETRRMVFGNGVDLPPSNLHGVGSGYVWLEGTAQPEAFTAPKLPQEPDKLYKLCLQALVDQKNLKLA